MSEQHQECEFARIKSVMRVNHKPHPFMVGTKHIVHASDHNHGMLGEDTMRAIPCAMRGYHASYDQHTSDKVAFVELKRDCSAAEMQEWLKSIFPELEPESVDGFAFIEGYKIA